MRSPRSASSLSTTISLCTKPKSCKFPVQDARSPLRRQGCFRVPKRVPEVTPAHRHLKAWERRAQTERGRFAAYLAMQTVLTCPVSPDPAACPNCSPASGSRRAHDMPLPRYTFGPKCWHPQSSPSLHWAHLERSLPPHPLKTLTLPSHKPGSPSASPGVSRRPRACLQMSPRSWGASGPSQP